MNVAGLAREFDLPPSRIIDLCSRLDIDATWAGAELSRSDEARLRARLERDQIQASPDHLPPTAVGSYPGLTDDEIPDHPAPGFVFAGDTLASTADDGEPSQESRPLPRSGQQNRNFDPSLRPALVATVLAAGALVAAEVLDLAPVVLAGWIFATVCLVVVIVSANRARYRISTHPERRRGLPLALALLAVAILGLAGLALGTWTVVRSAPAAQAPLGLGELRSVNHLRWGYQRLMVIADNGWSRPAKDPGTCWEAAGSDDEPRNEHRIEHGAKRVSCDAEHQFEVLVVAAVNRDADAPYPGPERLETEALSRCEDLSDVLVADAPDELVLLAEIPTREGWESGDHDVTCVSALPRDEPLRARTGS